MKISYHWLKNHINIPEGISAQEIADHLSGCGLEVEGIETFEKIPGGLKGIVVGEVLSKERILDTEKLSLTSVNIGKVLPLSIVCGASNVAEGQKVLVATHGTIIHDINGETREIKKGKIRGQVSEGMICAEDEIGIGPSHEGIMVLPDIANPGTPASEFLNLESDVIFEIGLTPNRSDAASHRGVARDLAAILNSREIKTSINPLPTSPLKPDGKETIDIIIADPENCPRYSGAIIKNIKVKESPDWLKNSLRSIGLKPINNIVDITNYILHDIGQPLHAFDLDKIKGKKVVIKSCDEGTKFTTLDGVERTLGERDLMICNESEPICIAGVFGGIGSGITNDTTSIFLESAYFNPASIRRTSSRHGLKTDASFRYERGADPEITITALNQAIKMITEIAGGELKEIQDLYPHPIQPVRIPFKYENFKKLTGVNIPEELTRNILCSLDMRIENETTDALDVIVPLFKSDVTREADLIEEVIRIYGYDKIPVGTSVRTTIPLQKLKLIEKVRNTTSDYLASMGFSEIMNTSLTKSEYKNFHLKEDADTIIKMMNPLSQDLSELRTTLLFGSLETVSYNLNRKINDLRVFEFGNSYRLNPEKPEHPFKETHLLGITLSGNLTKSSWKNQEQKMDLYFLKGIIGNLIERTGGKQYKAIKFSDEQFSLGFKYNEKEKTILKAGIVSRQILKHFDISQEVLYAELDFDAILQNAAKNKIQYQEISKFPEVRRDLSILLDSEVPFDAVKTLLTTVEKQYLKEINLFDVYEGNKLEPGKKSLAFSLFLQDEKSTLKDQQIEKIMEKIVNSLKEKLGATLR